MNITIALGLFFLFILVYIIIVNIFSILFRLTGLTAEDAKFQVISMLTNCGFTTNRSEIIMVSRLRRRLAKATILFGYSFTVIMVSIFINVFMTWNSSERTNLLRDASVLAGIFVICLLLMRQRFLREFFDRLIEKIGTRIMFGKSANVMRLVSVYSNRALVEVIAKRLPEFLIGTELMQSTLKEKYDILILLVRRNGDTLNHVGRHTVLKKGTSSWLSDPIIICRKSLNFRSDTTK